MRKFLAIKVFFWFWLTILCTLSLLISISFLQPDMLASKDISPPMLKNLFHLQRSLERHVERMPEKSIAQIISNRRHNKRAKVYLKHIEPEKSLVSAEELYAYDLALLNFAINGEPKAINTEKFRAYGPLKMHIRGDEFQLFMIIDNREDDLFLKVRLMPQWLKLSIILFASMLLSYWFARGLLKPIKQLQTAAAKLANGALSTRANVDNKRQDELGQLGKDFDSMASQLESQVLSQKRLLADISHELRSPLTRLQMATGIAASKASGDLDSYLQRIEKESQLLEHMLSDILQLSKLESGINHFEPHSISVIDLLTPVINDADFESQQLEKTLSTNELPDAIIEGDESLLSRAVENIVRNALKYAKGQVTVTSHIAEKALVLTVSDDGPGVSDDMLAKLCIPFYRASQSRTPDSKKAGGFGLGLAIAQHAIKVHHGHIEFNNRQGLCVTLTIPLQQL
ncbi:ATP-binding protein [Pseudoalteromonas luteoviolacea]|uniref:ATP-binding protein n=1 Tax=Pseudoalteromonas luteoviolacea TaxID=43657 RepID=UPI001F392E02|nr:ATP-binding protein [Pseudoalteromonas luteoviolacea]MCF6438925.1 ATP-binding protein [Pseudoalteromonas luteoviolacea]